MILLPEVHTLAVCDKAETMFSLLCAQWQNWGMKSELMIKLIWANYVLNLQLPREAQKIDVLKLYIH